MGLRTPTYAQAAPWTSSTLSPVRANAYVRAGRTVARVRTLNDGARPTGTEPGQGVATHAGTRADVGRPGPHPAHKKLSRWWLLDTGLLAVAIWWLGSLGTVFSGYPKGSDALGHVSKVQLILDYWPHINWNSAWYSGSLMFQGSYPPGYHLLVAATSYMGHLPIGSAMLVWAYLAVLAEVLGCYWTVLVLSTSRIAAVISSALLLTAPVLWAQELVWGLYPRTLGFSFAALGVAAAAFYTRRPSRLRATVTIVALSAGLGTHPVPGVIGVGLAAGVVVLAARMGPDAAGFWVRCRQAGWIAALGFSTSAYFYVPLLLAPKSQSPFVNYEQPLSWYALVFSHSGDMSTLAPAFLPLCLASIVGVVALLRDPCSRIHRNDVVVVPFDGQSDGAVHNAVLAQHCPWWQRRRTHSPTAWLLAFFGLAVAITVGYGLLGYIDPHFPFYVNGMAPIELLPYTSWLIAVMVGTGGSIALAHRRRATRALARGGAVALIGGSAVALVPVLTSHALPGGQSVPPALASLLAPATHNNHNYRMFGEQDLTSRWLNSVTSTAQVRGYDEQAALHLNWQYWVEDVISGTAGPTSPKARQYLLNYYAVKWLYTATAATDRTAARTPGLELTGSEHTYGSVDAWRYTGAVPMATAQNSPTVLVIGDAAHYDLVLRALSFADVGPSRLLPVDGGPDMAAMSYSYLSRFSSVLIYGPITAPVPPSGTAALAAYVHRGGHLIIDSGDTPGLVGSLAGAPKALLPVHATKLYIVKGKAWAFGYGPSDLARAAGAVRWSPPVYDYYLPWDTQTASHAGSGSSVVLTSHGRTVMASDHYGAGSVVWSGLNLPYHVGASTNASESEFFGRLLGAGAPTAPVGVADRFISPQQTVLHLPAGTDGVLFRQYTTSSWHASVGNQQLQVLPAGPDMAYVQLPTALRRTGANVKLYYVTPAVDQAANYASGAAALVLLAYAVGLLNVLGGGARRGLGAARRLVDGNRDITN